MEEKFNIVFLRLEELKLNTGILCKPFWKKVLYLKQEFKEEQCWALLIDKIAWLLKAKDFYNLESSILTTDELVSWFSENELNDHGIYFKGRHYLSNKKVIGLKDAKFEIDGHSEVILFDNSYAECGDTTFVRGYDNSSFLVTDCIGHAFENCKAEAKGLSIIENWTKREIKSGPNSLIVSR